jgi:ribonuclease E
MAESSKDKVKRQLIINYIPGEECRVAVVNNGRLDEFFSEKRDSVSHVGNIYVGRVTNVEPAIQAAFIDFGLEHAGFLHVTDVHPYYFPGEDGDAGEAAGATERVGKKTPRRERPPIQDIFKRGQEVVVQVLKEGVGSKGPTVTSYLSIPGRYLVMMPQMDKVGVSRKVEDEDLRKKMVAILDQLDLPDGFGFILRTAGLDRTKTELKRDLAYLMRLQKDMERRRKASTKPRLLYAESDLLLRALRDMLTADTDEVIVDSEVGLKRAGNFMRIFSPRSSTKLIHYTGRAPIYHALSVEEQIRTMYAREVPLPSGGRLVIDEAEALVAIDVNSGKSRSAGDSEENAFNTNLEAVEEICRQLRLRDLGGIVINDLIDMRSSKHRREIEQKFQSILETDRARSTVLPISDFGVLELTRQRMRGSHESIHFHDCPTCRGRGMIQRPESVAADALRDLSSIMDNAKIARAEMVIHPRLAGEFLSHRRKALSRLERQFGKVLAIRLSDATPMDRVTFYAYDAQGNDVEIDRLPKPRATSDTLKEWIDPERPEGQEEELEEFVFETDEPEDDGDEAQGADDLHPMEIDPSTDTPGDGENFSLASISARKKKRRRGRGGSDRPDRPDRGQRDGAKPDAPAEVHSPGQQPAHAHTDGQGGAGTGSDGEPRADRTGSADDGGEGGGERGGRRRRRRRRGGRGGAAGAPNAPGQGQPMGDSEPSIDEEFERLPPPPTAEDLAEGGVMTLGRLARLIRTRANVIIGQCLDEGVPGEQVASEESVIEPELEARIRAWFPPKPAPAPRPQPRPTQQSRPETRTAPQPDSGEPVLTNTALDPEADSQGYDADGPENEADDDADGQPAGEASADGTSAGPGDGAGGENGERRRRRRRRGGRNRNKNRDGQAAPAGAAGAPQVTADRGGGSSASTDAPPSANPDRPRRDDRRDDRRDNRRDGNRDGRRDGNRDGNRDRNREGNSGGGGGGAIEPKPAPAPATPAPTPTLPPGFRPLYGNAMKRLKPGSTGGGRRDE